MGQYQHFMSFTLEDTKTNQIMSLREDFKGIIINTDDNQYSRECMPTITHVTDKVDSVDGEKHVFDRYEPRQIEFTVVIEDDDLERFKKCVGSKGEKIFRWEDDWDNKWIPVVLNDGFETRTYYGDDRFLTEIELKFIAYDPYYRIENERQVVFNNLTVNTVKDIKNKGNVDSFPIISLTPTSTKVRINWNGLDITLSNLVSNRQYIMDCEKEEFYYMNGNKKENCVANYSSNKYFDYPTIYTHKRNTLKITEGTISKMNVNPNSRII